MKNLLIFSVIAMLASGCGTTTYSANRYAISTDNAIALRSLNGKTLNVGAFSATTPGQKELKCRGFRAIKTQQYEPFSEFIRIALLQELKIANSYSPSSPVTITGNLDAIDFSSIGEGEVFNINPAVSWSSTKSGSWNLALTVRSSNGKSMSVSEVYAYTSSLDPEAACNQTAQALMPAVQDLIGKIVSSPDFAALVSQ